MNLLSRVQKNPGNGTLALRCQQPRRAERLADRLYVDIARLLPRLEECNVLSIGRKLGPRNLGIAEDQVAIDQGRRADSLFILRSGGGYNQ